MYTDIKENIQKIIDARPPVFSISVRDIADELAKIYGIKPSPSTVKSYLNEMGFEAVTGKRRAWKLVRK